MRANNSYFTSPQLAALLWDVALRYVQPRTVLEPCAGDGALVRVGRARGVRVDGVEIDAQLCDAHGWEHADFLLKEPTAYDAVICNPPFSEIRQQGQNNSPSLRRTWASSCINKRAR
jgi:tRNA1(Val) A37 N6-methylase TrmN6